MPDDENVVELDSRPYYSAAFGIGIIAAGLMVLLEHFARRAGLTEMDLSMILGTVTTITLGPTPGAWFQGFLTVLACGGVFALFYAWVFEAWWAHTARAWLGALLGAGHAIVGGAILGWLMPPLHPSVPDHPLLADPGFMGSHYGGQTVAVFTFMHVFFGLVIGGWMHYAPLVRRYLGAVAERGHIRVP